MSTSAPLPVSRRNFLRLMTAAGIAGGAISLSGCTPQPNSGTHAAATGRPTIRQPGCGTAPEPP